METALESITKIEKKHKIESEHISRKRAQLYVQLIAKAKELEAANAAEL